MKKYTVVYAETIRMGIHCTRYEHVETDDITAWIAEKDLGGNVWFVFEGQCVEAKW